jgi:hypothetical protein
MIAEYLRGCAKGDPVAIRNAQGIGVRYVITTVTDITPGKGRLYTAVEPERGGRAWYLKTGRNCFHPKGKSWLVVPTAAVREFARLYPTGRTVKLKVGST